MRQAADVWVPASFLAILALACFVWPEVYTIPDPVRGSLSQPNLAPFSAHHILGTDPLGNDVFSRILYGGRVSLEVGFASAGIGMVLGGTIGMVASYSEGLLEAVIMRVLDMFLAFPSLILAIVIATYLGPSELHVIWAIAFFTTPAFARLASAYTRRVRVRTFVLASKLGGVSYRKMLIGHVAPNVLPPLLTFGLLASAIAIIVEASLSFLGLGVPAPGPSWGNMIAEGQQQLSTKPVLVLIPSLFLFVTVMAFNLLGDALRERWAVA